MTITPKHLFDAASLLLQLGYRWADNVGWTPPADQPAHKLNTSGSVVVATDVYFNPDMASCPRGAKVQLLGLGGVAAYGNYDGRDPFWIEWAPVPRRRQA